MFHVDLHTFPLKHLITEVAQYETTLDRKKVSRDSDINRKSDDRYFLEDEEDDDDEESEENAPEEIDIFSFGEVELSSDGHGKKTGDDLGREEEWSYGRDNRRRDKKKGKRRKKSKKKKSSTRKQDQDSQEVTTEAPTEQTSLTQTVKKNPLGMRPLWKD